VDAARSMGIRVCWSMRMTQRAVRQRARDLIYNAVHDGGDTSGLVEYQRMLADVRERLPSMFAKNDFASSAPPNWWRCGHGEPMI
jgi:hypothetical protein